MLHDGNAGKRKPRRFPHSPARYCCPHFKTKIELLNIPDLPTDSSKEARISADSRSRQLGR